MKAAFFTLGCKVNQYETDAMAASFRERGFEIVDIEDEADIYVINTCTVTETGDKKSRQIARRIKSKHPRSLLAVVGCYPQTAVEEVVTNLKADIVMGTQGRSRLADIALEVLRDRGQRVLVDDLLEPDFEPMKAGASSKKTRANLKIQDGCQNFCAYCIIPYARGPVRSKPLEEALKDIAALSDSGYPEIVLTGIHLSSYGRDLGIKDGLLRLLEAAQEIPGLKRLRMGSLEPTLITSDFVSRIKRLPFLCPHFHLSLQSGCDETLKRMKRRYTTEDFRKAVSLLRENIPDVAITTDIMTGFPGETEQEFECSREFVREMAFSRAHIFVYSKRKGTAAADMPGQVKRSVARRRAEILAQITTESRLSFWRSQIGKSVSVLLETPKAENLAAGYTPNYIPVHIPIKNAADFEGQFVEAVLTEVTDEACLGSIKN